MWNVPHYDKLWRASSARGSLVKNGKKLEYFNVIIKEYKNCSLETKCGQKMLDFSEN